MDNEDPYKGEIQRTLFIDRLCARYRDIEISISKEGHRHQRIYGQRRSIRRLDTENFNYWQAMCEIWRYRDFV